MKSIPLLDSLEFSQTRALSQALLGDQHHRILRFCLEPGQIVAEHRSPQSAVVLIVLSGTGLCSGSDGKEVPMAPHDMFVFAPGEAHAIRALDEQLVFMAILHGVSGEHAPVGVMTQAETQE